MNILVVIPARGGSKGIPRKNLRLLGGNPLLHYSIKNAMLSMYNLDVYVSSDDDEILNTALRNGAKIHKRNSEIANDEATLDPVIYACYEYAKKKEGKKYDFIITMQPTSPLLSIRSLDTAIERIVNNRTIDTIIAAKDATHLSWKKEGGKFIPNYKERVNRQYLTPEYTETGAFLITKGSTITATNRIGNKVDLVILNSEESIDIDTYEDWSLCEYYLRRKHLLFVVTGNKKVGLGHVYNTLLIANDILNHQITFLVDDDSQLAYDVIKSKNYPVLIQTSSNILDDIKKIKVDVVINDKLDTDKQYVLELKKQNFIVVNFEDLGTGSLEADLVINAIYPENKMMKNHFYGQDFFILRDEFLSSNEKDVRKDVKEVLITFGGVDPNNYTRKVIKTIRNFCKEKGISITVIAGFGYNKFDTLLEYTEIKIIKNVSNISDYMLQADLIFTSAGRTVYEIASVNTPTIVLEQNERESTHFFASKEFGFLNLGLGYNLGEEKLFKEFIDFVVDFDKREKMSSLMKLQNLKSGRKRVYKLIQDTIENS